MRGFIQNAPSSSLFCLSMLFLKHNAVDAFSIPAFARINSSPSILWERSEGFLNTPSFSSKSLTLAATGGRVIDTPPIDVDEESAPTLFYDTSTQSYIEVYIDHVAELADGKKYHIGMPCDYAVTLCHIEDDDLIPVELGSDLMGKIFPVAESLIEDEFGEELILQNTPQTLTLVGELDLDDSEDDEYDEEDLSDDEEEVQMLLSFDHEGKEYSLVRLLDPVLLVAGEPVNQESGVNEHEMLTIEESEKIIPELERLLMEEL
uniref:Nucleoplasmin-like domain-containing protein n=1 Tax=Corethron hystrix TaxID=216773 RepID=A0A7S1BVV7_9STRA|mmetsp:Transcript_4301/g.8352  ORF Transcript_4301/g.8352 Transcript_4301/m.8352 type:complete len:262 (+) Transcript_4301:161-946(+)|eukprot:CAMPEP_0113305182 /NCGR_PEP_ID=MMETSP0010_2-20120614/4897_1 /TAXON_ID=216773 ORGANISM="Corethron hystrix, Strain 308" /NCGR_SAMPLE_ID=MMETSP0010_2 /ASSEMBLY_ACC=CAM_ASM_000155 /LENGTH=261 /DNA_ID=CAMNT_0000159521 /DNA_START=159 /DNA_END=944 /DNA_ORIENTATION=+ /assembly_acc=CAM_ASM_000155